MTVLETGKQNLQKHEASVGVDFWPSAPDMQVTLETDGPSDHDG
jgi:hypothetical protein